ncbi:hypothetical protein BGZ49_010442 [Haplosporangium sp. Z 27]|nr:hypothetical protein BGZ49_010442 [Haplosporangium sp. Z 27]
MSSGSDQSEDYSSTNSQLDTETMDAILSTTVEKASSGTKALYELSKHLVTVTDDIMDYAKRKFDDSEEIVPVSLRECLERASKRTRQEACNCEEATVATLKEGLAFLKELRMMNEVSNEYLRLRTISQIVLLRSMTVMERNHLTPTAITNNKPAPSVSSTYSDTS